MRLEHDDIGQLSFDSRGEMGQGPNVDQLLINDLQVVRSPILGPGSFRKKARLSSTSHCMTDGQSKLEGTLRFPQDGLKDGIGSELGERGNDLVLLLLGFPGDFVAGLPAGWPVAPSVDVIVEPIEEELVFELVLL